MALIPEDDIVFLNEKEFDYTLVPFAPEVHLVIRRFSFSQYAPKEADLLIRLLSGYPLTAVDMFYTTPDVKLPSGGFPLNSDQHPLVGDKPWQQWSRHFAWRSGVDSLRTFLTAVAAEINKGI